MISKIGEYTIEYIDEYPTPFYSPTGNRLIVKRDNGIPKETFFRCPCGCGRMLGTHFEAASWKFIDEPDGTITIEPSILHANEDGCKSHFYIRHNKVVWC